MPTTLRSPLFTSLLSALLATACTQPTLVGDGDPSGVDQPDDDGGGGGGDDDDGGGGGDDGGFGGGGGGDDGGGGGGDDGGGGGGDGGGGGGGGGGGDAPANPNSRPAAGLSSSCGGVTPLELASAFTENGCNLAVGAQSGCPSLAPAGQTTDAAYFVCRTNPGQADCQYQGIALLECPFGGVSDTVLTLELVPEPGQAGYGYFIELDREQVSGSNQVSYVAFERGYNSDGSVAWEGEPRSGQSSTSAGSCCDIELQFSFPGSGIGVKTLIATQWF